MVTYTGLIMLIGKAYDKTILRRNIKKIVGRCSPKKSLFSTGGKKKSLQATKTLGPPPQISNGASLSCLDWSAVKSTLSA